MKTITCDECGKSISNLNPIATYLIKKRLNIPTKNCGDIEYVLTINREIQKNVSVPDVCLDCTNALLKNKLSAEFDK